MIEQRNFFALTGGPGAGKTTLIRHLQRLGETCVEESARLILRAEAAAGRPRPDQGHLGALMLARDLAEFRAARGRTFFDRGLVDAWATARLAGESDETADKAVRDHRYNRTAFIAPPWRAIYATDAERIQSWEEAVSAYEGCAEAYLAAGYELVELPMTDVARRAELVLEVAVRRGGYW